MKLACVIGSFNNTDLSRVVGTILCACGTCGRASARTHSMDTRVGCAAAVWHSTARQLSAAAGIGQCAFGARHTIRPSVSSKGTRNGCLVCGCARHPTSTLSSVSTGIECTFTTYAPAIGCARRSNVVPASYRNNWVHTMFIGQC